MDLAATLSKMASLLDELNALELGNPQSNRINFVDRQVAILPEFVSINGSKWIEPLYGLVDGLSLPDLWNGYFINSLAKVDSFDWGGFPPTVLLDRPVSVIPIGSDGGGNIFVVRADTGQVLLLFSFCLQGGVFHAREDNCKGVAESVGELMERMLDDLQAFLRDDRDHRYLDHYGR